MRMRQPAEHSYDDLIDAAVAVATIPDYPTYYDKICFGFAFLVLSVCFLSPSYRIKPSFCTSTKEEKQEEIAFMYKSQKCSLADLMKSKEELEKIERDTRGQGDNHLWLTERRKRLTAFKFGKICKMRKNTSSLSAIKEILYSNFKGNLATRYGKEHEAEAISEFTRKTDMDRPYKPGQRPFQPCQSHNQPYQRPTRPYKRLN
ncbi:herpesvirus alkaline exonuclease domain-containing protein [Phthorimaea operculella]|nr:herpesvirus alkaline exonuclease domain-containing protein [Phthorimaea operculella]